MSTTDITIRDRRATEPIRQQRRRPSRPTRALIGALAVVLSAVMTALGLWAAGTDRPVAQPVFVLTDPPTAYQPGGAVYEQQVPGTQHWSAGYGPGSYLYNAQVPSLQPTSRSLTRSRGPAERQVISLPDTTTA